MTILVKKVFISSKPTFVYLLCPPLCEPFSIQESAAGGLSYKEKYLVGFPTRHRRRFYSVFCKLVPVYLLVTIWVTANVSKKQRSSQQIRQAVFSFGDICCSAILFYGFHQELRITERLLHKIIRLHIMHPKICFTKFAWFFSRTLKLIICSFRMNNQHFNFWSSNDIYHVNFLLICFTQSKFLSARIQNPYHRNLLIESFP